MDNEANVFHLIWFQRVILKHPLFQRLSLVQPQFRFLLLLIQYQFQIQSQLLFQGDFLFHSHFLFPFQLLLIQ